MSDLSDRMSKHIIVDMVRGCRLWTGATDPDGYGQVSVDGKTKQAHWAAYEDAHGPVPEGLELDHTCRMRNCVNVAHLEAVTHAENVRRAAVAQKKIKAQDRGIEAPTIAFDPTEEQIQRTLGIPIAMRDSFRMNDVAVSLPLMLWPPNDEA